MGNSIFKRGYEASRAEKERQDKARENMGKRLFRFFLTKDGEEADLRFLNSEPVNFYEHSIQRGGRFENFTCVGEDNDCPFCADGNRATYKGAYLVIDRREYEYTDKQTGKKKHGKNQVRLFVQGMKVVSQLDRMNQKHGITNRDLTIVRLGTGTSTTYTFERGDEEKITSKEIRELLPEKLRDEYDGTQESLMAIIERQLMMNTKDYDPAADDDEDDDDETSGREHLVNLGDDDDDEDTSDAPPPTRPKGALKSRFRKSEHSVKPRAKGLLRKSLTESEG